ncbi:hypothetical protein [uncultured Chitinophaga sp.]|uniref:hypothetical protein n=1 Tax=uncultured Chitinophaga sp. TaxID=339340 RepID=UPI0025E3B648|nr:hypothetical protein [uncultured Chitinophaga sp.]
MRKHIVCLLAALTAGACFLRIGNRFLSPWIPVKIILAIALLLLLAGILSPFFTRKKQHDIPWLQGIIRYAIAFDLTMFGLQKILHLQFLTPLAKLDEPFSRFSAEDLTWAYFGHSYPFVVTIALAQISGSVLLLFSRTRLLGVFILLPVMANIIFIDLFYHLAPGVLAHACIMMAGLIYLLLLDYQQLRILFFAPQPGIPANNRVIKPLLRLSLFVIPCALLLSYNFPDKHPEIKGRYEARYISGSLDSLRIVYLDIANEIVLDLGGIDKRYYGRYAYDKTTGALQATWHFGRNATDTLHARLVKHNDRIELKGTLGLDELTYELQKTTDRH